MKKMYLCSHCHQYHPENNKYLSKQLKKSNEAVRFADLTFTPEKISTPKINQVQIMKELQFQIPKAHPQNMTISSSKKQKSNWNHSKYKNNRNLTSIKDQKSIQIRTNKQALKRLQNLKTTPAEKMPINIEMDTSYITKLRSNTKTYTSNYQNRKSFEVNKSKSIYKYSPIKNGKSSRKTNYQSISFSQGYMHQKSNKRNRINMDIDSQTQQIQLKGIQNQSRIISQLHRNELLQRIQCEIQIKSNEFDNRQSVYQFSEKKHTLDYAQQMSLLRKNLQERTQKMLIKPLQNNIKAQPRNNRIYVNNPHKKQNFTLNSNSCFGFSLQNQQGQYSVIELPELYI